MFVIYPFTIPHKMDNLTDALKDMSIQADKSAFFVFLPNDLNQIKPNDRAKENQSFNDAIAAKNVGNNKFRSKQYAGAIQMYDQAIEKFENIEHSYNLELAVCFQNRATAKMYKRDADGCITDASKAIELNEHYAKAFYRRATAYQEQRKYYRALQDTLQACILERFRNKTYTDMVAFLLTRIAGGMHRKLTKISALISDEHSTESQWKMAYIEMEANELYCDHCFQNQLKFIRNIGILDPISVPIPDAQTHIVGYIKAMEGLKELNVEKIMAGCKEEEAMKGNHLAQSFIVRAYMNAVVIQSTTNLNREYPKDLRRMNELIWDEKTPENIKFNALLCRANMYNRHGKFDEASAELSSLEQKGKNTPLIYIIKSGSLMQLAQSNPEFLKALNKCCTLLPNIYELHYQLCMVEIANPLNSIPGVSNPITKMEQLINRFPNQIEPRMCLAVIYTKLGETQKAKKLLKKAERELPNHMAEMSSVYGMLKSTHPSCVGYFKQSLQFNKDDPGSLKGLLDYYTSTTYEYAKVIEVATKSLYSFLQISDFQGIFEQRQMLLKKIVRQDYWHRL